MGAFLCRRNRPDGPPDFWLYHELPEWCLSEPRVTPQMATIVRASWKAVTAEPPEYHEPLGQDEEEASATQGSGLQGDTEEAEGERKSPPSSHQHGEHTSFSPGSGNHRLLVPPRGRAAFSAPSSPQRKGLDRRPPEDMDLAHPQDEYAQYHQHYSHHQHPHQHQYSPYQEEYGPYAAYHPPGHGHGHAHPHAHAQAYAQAHHHHRSYDQEDEWPQSLDSDPSGDHWRSSSSLLRQQQQPPLSYREAAQRVSHSSEPSRDHVAINMTLSPGTQAGIGAGMGVLPGELVDRSPPLAQGQLPHSAQSAAHSAVSPAPPRRQSRRLSKRTSSEPETGSGQAQALSAQGSLTDREQARRALGRRARQQQQQDDERDEWPAEHKDRNNNRLYPPQRERERDPYRDSGSLSLSLTVGSLHAGPAQYADGASGRRSGPSSPPSAVKHLSIIPAHEEQSPIITLPAEPHGHRQPPPITITVVQGRGRPQPQAGAGGASKPQLAVHRSSSPQRTGPGTGPVTVLAMMRKGRSSTHLEIPQAQGQQPSAGSEERRHSTSQERQRQGRLRMQHSNSISPHRVSSDSDSPSRPPGAAQGAASTSPNQRQQDPSPESLPSGAQGQGQQGQSQGRRRRPNGTVIFFEQFFHHWARLDPTIDLLFEDIRDRSAVMSRMLAFLMAHCDRLDRPDVLKTIQHIEKAHSKFGVDPRHYDTMARSVLLTLRTLLGARFTPEVQRAWIATFSHFFLIIFRMTPSRRRFVRAAPPPAPDNIPLPAAYTRMLSGLAAAGTAASEGTGSDQKRQGPGPHQSSAGAAGAQSSGQSAAQGAAQGAGVPPHMQQLPPVDPQDS